MIKYPKEDTRPWWPYDEEQEYDLLFWVLAMKTRHASLWIAMFMQNMERLQLAFEVNHDDA